MDTKKLRQKILDLAIRGKLVPQDPNDEPASVLLERIRAEKERLIAEGKIKRPKKSKPTSSESHYQNDIPKTWLLVKLGDISDACLGKMLDKAKNIGEKASYLRNINVRWFNFNLDDLLEMPFSENEIERYTIKKDDLVICEGGEPGRCAVWNKDDTIMYQKALHRVRLFGDIPPYYVAFYLLYLTYNGQLQQHFTGSGIKHLTGESLANLIIPLPPLEEQNRIVNHILYLFGIVEDIEHNSDTLTLFLESIKSKILELAMRGKLVPQDLSDEPAADMLRRINPKAQIITDTPHYPSLPASWVYVALEDIVNYEQPQPYIVSDTNYSDEYATPVLTAGKSFILGYTNETKGVYKKLPVIIFDDFTTDSRIIDFPFKVKSSALKILSVREKIDIRYVAAFMSITRLNGDTHKRYWISEYSKLLIPLPPIEEQQRIANAIEEIFEQLDSIQKWID